MTTAASVGRGDVSWEKLRSVHLIAIGGVAMAAVAGLFKQRGVAVRGSDEPLYPPMSDVLARLGIAVLTGYGPENLEPRPDLVIVGNKVSRDNPEVQALLASEIPYRSMPAALGELFLADRRSLVVAGTHGKTTSTAMLAWVLQSAGRDPSVLVGGDTVDFSGNFKLGGGEFFVIEGDEYDTAFFDKGPKFLHYRPSAAILTAVEFDHADIYRDLDAVMESFRRFVALLPAAAPLAVGGDCANARSVAAAAPRARVATFGVGDGLDWTLRDRRDTGEAAVMEVCRRGAGEGTLRLRQPGRINALNALGVYALARELGLAHEEIASGLATFSGVARRQQLVGELAGITLIDDFAHHPTAVAGVLEALRERYPQRRLWAIFEPRSNTSRRAVFQDQYAAALRQADLAIIGGVFQKDSDRVGAADQLSPQRLVDELNAAGVEAWTLPDAARIEAHVVDRVRPGDVVVLMSNGAFGGLRSRLVAAFAQRGAARRRP
jgi:UDP-N-acetylmuramate: L-alanyl-gamma-D-glutamyl-meso-diaminopimelate ligase